MMKKQQNLRKKPTYHFEESLAKISQWFNWFDGLVKWVFKPYLGWLGLECFTFIVLMLSESMDKSFIRASIREAPNTFAHLPANFMASWFHTINIFMLSLLILPLIPVFISNVWYLFNYFRKGHDHV
ncbi:hypothetical protein EFM21_09025 [Leuconostoc falkenbergense]|uniref:hypothetical protein n=1 Tax=Leuconostoc falkenbergense TaxID=2766470 RepID=UPI0021A9F2FC|nr:hypothetical protein [Leuconostoc falkenbergense]MCT4379273.1 hypothetical protein [Leuconostoc falkenbergense]